MTYTCDDEDDENTFYVLADDPLSEVIDVEADAVFVIEPDDEFVRPGEDSVFLRSPADNIFERPTEDTTFYRVA
jgi:hypothetical protein